MKYGNADQEVPFSAGPFQLKCTVEWAEVPKLIKSEDNRSDRISSSLWAWVCVETELMKNAGEHKWAVAREFIVEK